MKFSKQIAASAFIILTANYLFSSCNKKKSDITKPTIAVVEPLLNDTLSLTVEPEVHIEFTASDNDELNVVDAVLIDSTGLIVYSSNLTVSGLNMKVYPFHEHIIPNVTSLMPMTLTITVKDKSQNVATKVIDFCVEP